MMFHHNMLSITAFTFLTSFARKSEIYVQNWLYICLPTLDGILHPATLYVGKQIIEPQTFSNIYNHYINEYAY